MFQVADLLRFIYFLNKYYSEELVFVAVDGDDGSLAGQNTAVGKTEIADRSSQDNQIGFLERFLAMLSGLKMFQRKEFSPMFSSIKLLFYLERTVGSEETAGHAAQVARNSQSVDGSHKLVALGRR